MAANPNCPSHVRIAARVELTSSEGHCCVVVYSVRPSVCLAARRLVSRRRGVQLSVDDDEPRRGPLPPRRSLQQAGSLGIKSTPSRKSLHYFDLFIFKNVKY